ncbi:MAG: nuclear transport factor 2 family protein [Myxococcota bacterium]|nr:nuclear transport factor 2 family protein [Myxococcota bacterium]
MSNIEKRLDELEHRVQDVAARDAIRELTADYCRQVVRGSTEGMVALFTDDASLTTHFPEQSGQDSVAYRGAAELREAYADLGAMGLMPFIHNHIIELEGERARGFCSVEIRLTQGGVAYTGAGHYQDEYRRVDGSWRFQSRELFVYHWAPYSQGWA